MKIHIRSAHVVLLLASIAAPHGMAQPSEPLEKFLSKAFSPGRLYESGRPYGSNPSNIVQLIELLGMIGDVTAIEPLIAWLEKDPKDYESQACIKKSDAMFALGYLANHFHNQRALDYLAEGTDPARWDKAPSWK